jgi:predicted permease
MWHDFRQALRTLRKHPGFLALAAVVLGLGVGLNTAIFSIVYAMLFRPLPVSNPSDLVSLYVVMPRQPDRPFVFPNPIADFYRKHSGLFTDVTMHWGSTYSLRADGETDPLNVEWVESNYFSVLGVQPLLGRVLTSAEDTRANPDLALVISHALWSRRFDADPNIVGKQVMIVRSNEPDLAFTIVGVMAPAFKGVSEPWKPTQAWMTFAQGLSAGPRRSGYSGAAIGRLKAGITFKQAQAVVAAQSSEAAKGLFAPGVDPKFLAFRTDDVRVPNNPSASLIPRRLAGAMTIVAAMVLLVAATNIAGILMARGIGRSSEIAVRRVLGATPLRLVRQLLAESVLLSVVGGALGVLFAVWLLELFRRFTPLQFAVEASMDPAVVVFTTATCLISGIVVGVMPARQALRLDILPWLAGSSTGQTRQTRRRLRHAMTLPQVALSLVLLLVAAVYVRALLRHELANPGYGSANLVVVNPILRLQPGEQASRPTGAIQEKYAERSRRFYRQLLEGLRVMPGAQDVAIASALPLREPGPQAQWSTVSQADFQRGNRHGPPAERTSVSPGYFRTMRMTVVSGRDFDERDTGEAPPVAIVSAGLARQLWPGRDPLEQSFTILSSWEASNKDLKWFRVVGIASDVTPVLYDRDVRPFVYFPLGQEWSPWSGYVLARAVGDSRTLIPAIKSVVAGADAMADVTRTQTMVQMVNEIRYPRRIAAATLAVSGALALFLATIGIYGVVSYSVAQRTGEIGVRIALGAERRDIMRLVLRDGAWIATMGSVAGLVLGYTAIRITSSRFLALPSVDLAALIVTPLILTAVVLLACYVPARRAGRVDAMEVLRRV